MSICHRTRTQIWVKDLQVGLDHRRYTVQLNREICCGETYRLFVNNQEIEDHQLTRNRFSPLCGAGGRFEFEQDGHTFLVMYNSLSWRMFGEFRLFIEGIDMASGRELSAYWRYYGWRTIVAGLAALIIGIVVLLVLHFADLPHREHVEVFMLPLALAFVGVVRIIFGIITILKYRSRKPTYSRCQEEIWEQTPSTVSVNISNTE